MAADVHSERENPDLTTAEADVADVAGHPVAAGDAEPTADAGPESADSAEPAGGDETVNDAAVDDAAAGTGTAVGDAARAPQGPRRIRVLLVVAALALTIDVISKLLVVAHLSDRDPIRLPGGFLRLTLVRNSGAAFSIGESQTWMFTIIAAAVVVVILRISRNLRSLGWACALGLLLGGALGNLSDRIFRSPGLFRGHVVDFLQFPRFPVVDYDFPVFNLADSAIVVGGCLMVLLSFLGRQPDGTRHTKAGPVEPAGRDGGDSRDSRD